MMYFNQPIENPQRFVASMFQLDPSNKEGMPTILAISRVRHSYGKRQILAAGYDNIEVNSLLQIEGVRFDDRRTTQQHRASLGFTINTEYLERKETPSRAFLSDGVVSEDATTLEATLRQLLLWQGYSEKLKNVIFLRNTNAIYFLNNVDHGYKPLIFLKGIRLEGLEF
eukprot:m.16528 g.16528  ORF g.16528 m.16528 type:complete len:169 (-) comp10975_c0_seq4:769-1275(-)